MLQLLLWGHLLSLKQQAVAAAADAIAGQRPQLNGQPTSLGGPLLLMLLVLTLHAPLLLVLMLLAAARAAAAAPAY